MFHSNQSLKSGPKTRYYFLPSWLGEQPATFMRGAKEQNQNLAARPVYSTEVLLGITRHQRRSTGTGSEPSTGPVTEMSRPRRISSAPLSAAQPTAPLPLGHSPSDPDEATDDTGQIVPGAKKVSQAQLSAMPVGGHILECCLERDVHVIPLISRTMVFCFGHSKLRLEAKQCAPSSRQAGGSWSTSRGLS